MLFKNTPVLDRLAAHSALFALLYFGISALLAPVMRALPPALRPARAWPEPHDAWDLDERRLPCKRQGNRRIERRDRRRNAAYARRGLRAYIHSDRRAIASGRRNSDWHYSSRVRE